MAYDYNEALELLISETYNPNVRRVNPQTLQFGDFRYPESIKAIFQLSEYFSIFDPILGPIANKLMSYPITDLQITTTDDDLKAKWEDILEDSLSIRTKLKEIAYDFFTYGNVFLWVRFPTKRVWVQQQYLKDNPQLKRTPYEKIKQQAPDKVYDPMELKFEVGRGKIWGIDKKRRKFAIQPIDIPIEDFTQIKLIKFSPYDIEIDYIDVTDTAILYYHIPGYLKRRVLKGDPDILNTLPVDLLQACLKDATYLRFSPNSVYHLKGQPFPGNKVYPGWGMPYTIYALKMAQYTELLMRGNTIMAKRFTLPVTLLFPNPVGSIDPSRINLKLWLNWIKSSLKEAKKNPTTIALAPYPTSSTPMLGGNFRQLSVTPEINNASQFKAAALHFSLKFLQGETTFANAMVIARMMRNAFAIFTKALNEITNHIVDKIHLRYNIPKPVEVKWKETRIVDDMQKTQLMLNMAQAGKISTDYILEQLDVDPEANFERLKKEIERDGELQKLKQNIAAEIQGEARAAMEASYTEEKLHQMTQSDQFKQLLGQLLTQTHPYVVQQFLANLKGIAPDLATALYTFVQKMQAQAQNQNAQDNQSQSTQAAPKAPPGPKGTVEGS